MFFCDLFSAKTPTFESISGRKSSNKTLKSRCFRREVHEQIKQTSRDSSTLAKSMGVLLQIRLFRPIWPKTICPISNPAEPKRLSKVGILAETSMKKSKKHHAIAPLWPTVWECCSNQIVSANIWPVNPELKVSDLIPELTRKAGYVSVRSKSAGLCIGQIKICPGHFGQHN